MEKIIINKANIYLDGEYGTEYECPKCKFNMIKDEWEYCPKCGSKIEWYTIIDTDNEKLFKELIKLVKDLGWDVAIPTTSSEDECKGMIIGEEHYINYILKHLD